MAEKKKQQQPKHHAAKSKIASALRRKQIIKKVASGKKTLQETGEEVGLSKKTAASQVCKILNEPQTASAFKALLDKVIPDDDLAETYRKTLNATKTISALVIAPGGEGMKDANSMTRDFVEVDDFAVMLKSADSVSKLKGHLVEKHEVDMSAGLMGLVAKQLNSGNGKENHTRASKKS